MNDFALTKNEYDKKFNYTASNFRDGNEVVAATKAYLVPATHRTQKHMEQKRENFWIPFLSINYLFLFLIYKTAGPVYFPKFHTQCSVVILPN